MSENGAKIELPKNKFDKAKLLEELYLKAKNCKTDSERWNYIRSQVIDEIGDRTFKLYKQEFHWKEKLSEQDRLENKQAKERRKAKPIKHHITQKAKTRIEEVKTVIGKMHLPETYREREELLQSYIDMPVVKLTGRFASERERALIVKNILEYLSYGLYSLDSLCKTQGIRYSTFWTWVTENDVFFEDYQKAREKHNTNYVNLLEEYLKVWLLQGVSDQYLEEVTLKYVYQVQFDRESGRFTQKEVLDSKTVKRTPIRPDGQTMSYLMQLIRDLKATTKGTNESQLAKYEKMSVADLDQEIEAREKHIAFLLNRENPQDAEL